MRSFIYLDLILGNYEVQQPGVAYLAVRHTTRISGLEETDVHGWTYQGLRLFKSSRYMPIEHIRNYVTIDMIRKPQHYGEILILTE